MKIQKYLNSSPVFSVNAAYEAILVQINQGLKKENLNLLQGLVLTALFFEDKNDISPSELAKVFRTSRGNMSHIISHLEYQGWIKREVSTQDARKFHIILKTDGKKKSLKLIKYFDKVQDFFETQMGPQNCKNLSERINQLSQLYKIESPVLM
jgi:DNA-binding MarR family transcriptional regulator